MSRIHFIITADPPAKVPVDVRALCQKELKNVLPLFIFDIEAGQLECASTILCCPICWPLTAAPVEGRKYIIGLDDAEKVRRMNLQHDQE